MKPYYVLIETECNVNVDEGVIFSFPSSVLIETECNVNVDVTFDLSKAKEF